MHRRCEELLEEEEERVKEKKEDWRFVAARRPKWPSQFWIPNVRLLNNRNQSNGNNNNNKKDHHHQQQKKKMPQPPDVLVSPPTPLLAPPPPSSSCSDDDVNSSSSSSLSSSSKSSSFEDLTSLLSDELLLRILSRLPPESHTPTSLVSSRFLRLLGLLRTSLTLLHLPFLLPQHKKEGTTTGSGGPHSLPLRFPNLTSLNLLPSLLLLPSQPSPLLLSRGPHSLPLDPSLDDDLSANPSRFPAEQRFVRADEALLAVARTYPSLRSLSLAATASDSALLELADRCPTLQDLEIHRCHDASLRPISAFANLQILRLVADLPGVYSGPGVTDVGLTILARGCKRLVKLELCGCEGSYDGISAVGKCCPMLEELVMCDHRMDAGWVAGLSYCGNLRTLKMVGCRGLDADPGPEEHLGTCEAMERLHLQRCQLRDRRSLGALLSVCRGARDVVFQDCWGLDDDMFTAAAVFWRVNFLCIEGCSLLTTGGLESVIITWKELQSLSVVTCKSMKDSEISPTLSSLFAILKELKWRPDSRSTLLASLKGTGMWKKGVRFFKRA